MGTHPIFESDFDCLTEQSMGKRAKGVWENGQVIKKNNSKKKKPTDKKEGGKVEKKYVNEFTASRNEKRPNQYSKEAQTKREKLTKLKQENKKYKKKQLRNWLEKIATR